MSGSERYEAERYQNRRGSSAAKNAVALWMALALAVAGFGGCGQIPEESGEKVETTQEGSTLAPESKEDSLSGIEAAVPGIENVIGKVSSENGGVAYYDGHTTVVLDGEVYDIQERCESVNGIKGIQAVDGYWIVQGHISPNNSYYGFYNRETLQWDKEIVGSCLAWYEAEEEEVPFSMDSIVYMIDNGLYDSEGELIQKIELDDKEYEYIYGLRRTRTGVEVRILNAAVEEREVVVTL